MKQKIRFCFFLVYIVLIPFYPYGSHKNIINELQNNFANPDTNVILTLKSRVPYCGGAKPSPERLNMTEIEKHSDFIIQFQQGYGDSLWYKECKTDSSGMLYLYLPEGKYCLKRANKNVTFDDFYKMYKKEDDDYNLYRDSTCYYHWYKSCELEFQISKEETSIDTVVTINSRCYTGEDPCHVYRGTYPP